MKKLNTGARLSAVLLILLLILPQSAVLATGAENCEVYLGGEAFGVRFFSGKLTVSSVSEVDAAGGNVFPARDAGICENDEIVSINGKAPETADDLTSAVENSGGKPIELVYKREGNETKVSITPQKSESTGKFRIGLWLRDSTAGIGTLTYIIPDKGGFGGLGHGICDSVTGEIVSLERGIVTDVKITGITKGAAGEPGELHGFFSSGKTGVVSQNTECGVFGLLTDISARRSGGTLIETGTRDKVQNGKAKIRCTLENSTPAEYEVEITKDSDNGDSGDKFSIKVTDAGLLEKTGGIVQGMSGSPVIQNGILIGAVTHVLISDPTEGYGIYIDSMMAKMPEILK